MFSRISCNKGWDIFLEAMNYLKKQSFNYKAIVIGGGPEEKEFLRRIKQYPEEVILAHEDSIQEGFEYFESKKFIDKYSKHGSLLKDKFLSGGFLNFFKMIKIFAKYMHPIMKGRKQSFEDLEPYLKELNSNVSIEQMKKELEKYFKDLYEVAPEKEIISPNQISKVSELKNKYSSWEWRYGQAPDFDITYDTRFDWGDIELGLSLSKGAITNAKIYSDAMNADLIEDIANNLKGCQFKIDSVTEAIKKVDHDKKDEKLIKDLISWLKDKRI